MASVRALPARPFVHRDAAVPHLCSERPALKVLTYREWSTWTPPLARPLASPHPLVLQPIAPRCRLGGVVLTGAVTLAACTAPPPVRPPWVVTPVQRLEGLGGTAVARGYVALAQSYEQQGRLALAGDTFDKAARWAADDTTLLTLAGVGLARTGRPDDAVRVLQQAATLQPTQPATLNNLGHALMLAGRDHEAVAVLREALALAPAHARALANLAEAQRREGAPAAQAPVAHAAEAAPAAPAPTPPKAPRLAVVNGLGLSGAAARMAQTLIAAGLTPAGKPRLQNLMPYQVRDSVIEYRAGWRAEAEQAARSLPGARLDERTTGPSEPDLRIVLGHNQREWLNSELRSVDERSSARSARGAGGPRPAPG